MKSIVTIILFASLSACSDWPAPLCDGDQWVRWSTADGHEVNAVEYKGLAVDVPDGFDADRIVEIVDAVDTCLAEIGELPSDEAEVAWCDGHAYTYAPIQRGCFETKVESDWHWSRDGRYQMLWDKADRWYCRQKGLDVERECYWRTAIQHGYQIITTPDLQLYADALVLLVTRCDRPRSSPRLSRCATLSVTPIIGDQDV